MPLINCPDCNREVSDQAANCPQCARPLGGPASGTPRAPVQTVEQTGKKWKAVMLVAFVVAMLGVAIFFSSIRNRPLGEAVAIPGFVGFLVARIGAWWQHG